MKYAKVYTLNEKVEVIVKKIIIKDEKYGMTMNFITEEDDVMINITVTAEFNFKDSRDKSYDNLNLDALIKTAKTLPTFKNLV